jgi:hypothetical protein
MELSSQRSEAALRVSGSGGHGSHGGAPARVPPPAGSRSPRGFRRSDPRRSSRPRRSRSRASGSGRRGRARSHRHAATPGARAAPGCRSGPPHRRAKRLQRSGDRSGRGRSSSTREYRGKSRAGSIRVGRAMRQEVHPIIAAFFYTAWLPWVFGGFLVAFVLFVLLFEPEPAFGRGAVRVLSALRAGTGRPR